MTEAEPLTPDRAQEIMDTIWPRVEQLLQEIDELRGELEGKLGIFVLAIQGVRDAVTLVVKLREHGAQIGENEAIYDRALKLCLDEFPMQDQLGGMNPIEANVRNLFGATVWNCIFGDKES